MELLENPTYFWGLIGVTVIVLGLWLYRRAHHNAADNELFNNMGDAYFESDPLLDNEPQARNTEQGLETEMNTFAQSMDSNSSNE
ncbi:hypothetical protein [Candidatus Albibeggiatoa sp. nov. BB20]|uniref:hypothetical protein n=1 Tax=Candidatus Albibeggiatoa sp. nov. BB20 TaxID=3162723 RepID=UPI003365A126